MSIVCFVLAAGIVDCAAMSIEEKQTFLKAILASKEVDSIEIEESHQQNSSGSPSTNPGHSPNSEIYEVSSLLSVQLFSYILS